MTPTLTREFITDALCQPVLDPKLRALYDLCFMHRHHMRDDIVVDKLRLIMRLYADAPTWPDKAFSAKATAHRLSHSPVDHWFGALSSAEALDSSLPPELHKRLMEVFSDMREDEARSLASKYLHFHFPELFHVYDSRIAAAIALLMHDACGVPATAGCDLVYGRFHACCRKLTERIAPLVGRRLSPREMDRVLRAWLDADEAAYAGQGVSYAASTHPRHVPAAPSVRRS